MGAFEAAEVALRILHALVRLQGAVDPRGCPLQPLPAVHRALASPQCLPHIAQVPHARRLSLANLSIALLSDSAQCKQGHAARDEHIQESMLSLNQHQGITAKG